MADDMEKGHPDAPQDQAQIDANLQALIGELTPVLQYLIEKVDTLEKTLMDTVIGGLSKAHRDEGIMGLKGKYGDQFKDLLDYKHAVHGADPEGFFGELHDLLQGGGDESQIIQMIMEALTKEREDHKSLLLGKPEASVEVSAQGEPEAVQEAAEQVPEVVEQAVEAAPEPEKKEEKKDEEPAVGSPEYFKKHGRKAKASKAQ